MDNIVGKKSGLTWAVHISVALLVALWLFPTVGLFVSSFRTSDQIVSSGWWSSFRTQEAQLAPIRLAGEEAQQDGRYVIEGTLFPRGQATLSAWGTNVNRPTEFAPGDTADLGNGATLTVDETYAIVAYILYSNGLVDDDFELSHESFLDIRLPNEGGFYEDDRDTTEVPRFTHEPCMSDCREVPVVSFRATALNVTPIVLPPARIPGFDHPAAHDHAAAPAPEPEPEPAPAAAAGPDPALLAAGEAAWRQCRACHTVGAGARNGTGPALNGILGRQAGTMAGFRYSPQMVAAGEGGLVWTEQALDGFLENPAGSIPRNRMSFRGVRSAEERAALIAYLSTFAD